MSGWLITRPIGVWPHPPTKRRARSPFSATWSATLALLAREVRQLGARGPVALQIAVGEEDIRLDGQIRAAARPSHPGVIVSFESRHGSLVYATDVFDRWQDNVRAIALGLEALRRVDRYGIARSGEQYAGWKQLAAGDSPRAVYDRGAELVHRHGSVHAALKATHPDHGGTADELRAVVAYRDGDLGSGS